jgi:hypothetical protein
LVEDWFEAVSKLRFRRNSHSREMHQQEAMQLVAETVGYLFHVDLLDLPRAKSFGPRDEAMLQKHSWPNLHFM